MTTCGEAIREAIIELGGIVTRAELVEFIEIKYPGRWKDIGTNISDLCIESTSAVQRDRRFLSRIGRGRYKLIDAFPLEVVEPKKEIKEEKDTKTPFKESEAESILVDWFSNQGYKVITQCIDDPTKVDDISECKTHSVWGIDIVAQKGKELWIIEVKGEDKGGSASADVNFNSGMGQLMAYMKSLDENINYGAAIPHPSSDFKRAIKRMGKSKAFERLGIHLFLVEKNGTVTKVLPQDFEYFAEKL